MNYRLWEILDELSTEKYNTAETLGGIIGASEKTIRSRMKEINHCITQHGAEVISKPRFGYRLTISEPKQWRTFLKSRGSVHNQVPEDSKERIDYLLAVFLNRTGYIKMEELSNFLFISTKTLSNELKKVEYILSRFGITLERKPYYGIQVNGCEFDKRRCILNHFFLSSNSFGQLNEEQEGLTKKIGAVLLQLITKHQMKFAETAFLDTVLYIYISLSRMKKGIFIEEQVLEGEPPSTLACEVAEQMYELIQAEEGIAIPSVESYYTGIYIAGKRSIHGITDDKTNFVISEQMDGLVARMLEEIYQTYSIELRDDLNLRIRLSQHMIPMNIRLKYGILIEQNIAEDVKDKYFFTYSMAQQATAFLEEEYGSPIPEEEIACLALYIQLALEDKKSQRRQKKNILLVCISGNASSQMLMYRFKREFGEYIQTLEIRIFLKQIFKNRGE